MKLTNGVAAEFLRSWVLLLEHIESAVMCTNAEVSLAALKCFQEILLIGSSRSAKTEAVGTKLDASAGAYLVLWLFEHQVV